MACHRNNSLNRMLTTENAELRSHNELLAKEVSHLRKQIDTRDLLYNSTSHLDSTDFREF